MKTAELNKIIKEIKFEDKFIKNGRLAYYIIKDKSGAAILIGFYLDSSVDKDAFFLQYFVQCLYVPFSTYNFSLGERIGNHWKKEEINDINLSLQNFKKFNFLNSFEDIIPYILNNSYCGHKIGRDEYLAYTYFILGKYSEALQYIEKITALKKHENAEWFKKAIQRAELIKEYIIKNDYDSGIYQLLKWQNETITALKQPKLLLV